MTITRTVELTDKERLTVQNFLKLADEISDAAGCSMDDVMLYFSDKAVLLDDDTYRIVALHQLTDIH